MEELNFIGGGFDDLSFGQDYDEVSFSCRRYHNKADHPQLAVNSVRLEHRANCLTPWELPDACIPCFAEDDILPPVTELYTCGQHNAAPPIKTYAQAAAWSSEYDAAWEPLVEPMPSRRPRSVSVSEAARLAMHSQPRQQTARTQGHRQTLHIDDVSANAEGTATTSRCQILTYAEAAQRLDSPSDLSCGRAGRHSLFTSTENSSGLPNQVIYRAPHQPPHRTSRNPTVHVAPYPISQNPRRLSQDVSIPTLTQPEHNSDPRDPYTLVQRTGRGGHREPVTSSLGLSGRSSPLSCDALSTVSAASRPRRKGNALKDPTLPFKCPECGRTYAEKDNLTSVFFSYHPHPD